ncbi:hypothetical protein LC612_33560 [Nostoc sp. CHAB 5834]|nr:hypothetical protein [Nostoc sp. CHAB 5834]
MTYLIPTSLSVPQARPVAVDAQGARRRNFYTLASESAYIGIAERIQAETGPQWVLLTGGVVPDADVKYWGVLPAYWSLAARNKIQAQPFDSDGYPTSYALNTLQTWPFMDPLGWFNFAKQLWSYPDRFVIQEEPGGVRVQMSTAGWSGNESIVSHMRKNLIWEMTWIQSGRGGWYELFVTKEDEGE